MLESYNELRRGINARDVTLERKTELLNTARTNFMAFLSSTPNAASEFIKHLEPNDRAELLLGSNVRGDQNLFVDIFTSEHRQEAIASLSGMAPFAQFKLMTSKKNNNELVFSVYLRENSVEADEFVMRNLMSSYDRYSLLSTPTSTGTIFSDHLRTNQEQALSWIRDLHSMDIAKLVFRLPGEQRLNIVSGIPEESHRYGVISDLLLLKRSGELFEFTDDQAIELISSITTPRLRQQIIPQLPEGAQAKLTKRSGSIAETLARGATTSHAAAAASGVSSGEPSR